MNLIGKMLAGRYEILEEVGKGGMAHVYKARCHFLDRLVAVKVLKEEHREDKEFVHRFNTEAQAAARISNPHIVSIYDVGYEEGLYYIVMEYIKGVTLKEYISEKGALSWREAGEYAAQICEGLEEAHKKSVIHRDVKPQNIIMTEDGVLKVTDFGIARASSQATMTMANSTIGTVHYLSPEQARGGYTNERTDIYSLGVVLYEMLTGRLPFDDNTAVAIAIKHIQEKPILPRILNNDIPKSMEDIVMKAMNKEQDLRYASAADMLKDLRAVMANPQVKLTDSEELDVTRKRDAIDERTIKEYEKKKEDTQVKEREEKEGYMRSIDKKRAEREQKKKERKITIIAILTAIAVIIGMGFAFSALSGGLFQRTETTKVPDIVGMQLKEAREKYNKEGFSIIATEVDSDKPEGEIVEQDPKEGTKKTKGEIKINVRVSKGDAKEFKAMKSYIDLKADEAEKKIKEEGFNVSIQPEDSPADLKDIVLRQEPVEGVQMQEGATVTIYVGNGEEKEEIEPPKPTTDPEPTTTPEPTNDPAPQPEPPTPSGSGGETVTPGISN